MLKLTLFFISAAILTLMILWVAPDSWWIIGIFLAAAGGAVFFLGVLFLSRFLAVFVSLFVLLVLLFQVLKVLDLVNGVVLAFFMLFLGILIKQLLRR